MGVALRQNVISPDYVVVHQDIALQFKSETRKTVTELYGDSSFYYNKIAQINQRQLERLSRVITNSGGALLMG
jgi:hypothetical protein